MHQNWGAIISALGGLLGTLSVLHNSFSESKKDNFTQTMNELRSELEQKQKDAELYRERWFKAEKNNEELRDTIEKLRNQITKLKEQIEKLKSKNKNKEGKDK